MFPSKLGANGAFALTIFHQVCSLVRKPYMSFHVYALRFTGSHNGFTKYTGSCSHT